MKKISLSEVEVNDLIDLYQSEIDRAQRRIINLKSIIKKISDGKNIDAPEEKPEKLKGKRGRKPKAKTTIQKVEKEITVEPKKRGRKPKTKTPAVKVEKEIISEPKKRGRKPKVKPVIVKAEPKKRGRKPKDKAVETSAKKEVTKKIIKKEPKKKVSKVKEKPTLKKRGRKPKTTEIKVAEVKAETTVVEKKAKPKVSKKKIAKSKAEPKKRGRKPKSLRKPIKGGKGKEKVKWNDFIFESLSSKNTLLPASAITQAAIEKFEIHESDRDRVRMAISTTLTKMANKDKILKTYSQQGVRGAFFGLSTWFNENELKEEYKINLN